MATYYKKRESFLSRPGSINVMLAPHEHIIEYVKNLSQDNVMDIYTHHEILSINKEANNKFVIAAICGNKHIPAEIVEQALSDTAVYPDNMLCVLEREDISDKLISLVLANTKISEVLQLAQNYDTDRVCELLVSNYKPKMPICPFSQKTIEYMSKNYQLCEIGYIPAKYTANEKYANELLADADNQDENTICWLVTNTNLPDHIRDRAFDIVFDADTAVLRPTPYIRHSLYNVVAESVFSGMYSETTNPSEHPVNIMYKMLKSGCLNEDQELDYIHRYLYNIHTPDSSDKPFPSSRIGLDLIAHSTKSGEILKTIYINRENYWSEYDFGIEKELVCNKHTPLPVKLNILHMAPQPKHIKLVREYSARKMLYLAEMCKDYRVVSRAVKPKILTYLRDEPKPNKTVLKTPMFDMLIAANPHLPFNEKEKAFTKDNPNLLAYGIAQMQEALRDVPLHERDILMCELARRLWKIVPLVSRERKIVAPDIQQHIEYIDIRFVDTKAFNWAHITSGNCLPEEFICPRTRKVFLKTLEEINEQCQKILDEKIKRHMHDAGIKSPNPEQIGTEETLMLQSTYMHNRAVWETCRKEFDKLFAREGTKREINELLECKLFRPVNTLEWDNDPLSLNEDYNEIGKARKALNENPETQHQLVSLLRKLPELATLNTNIKMMAKISLESIANADITMMLYNCVEKAMEENREEFEKTKARDKDRIGGTPRDEH